VAAELPTAVSEIYSERYVAFIDILGFSDIVRQSSASPARAAGLIAILEKIADAKRTFVDDLEISPDDFKAQSFSDCIVLSENASPSGLFHLLAAVTIVSLDLLSEGVFTRGGIAKGKLHHSDKVAFGPAMIEAYRLESQIARYPRILVDKATHTDYKAPEYSIAGERYSKNPALRLDSDGPPFLDILVLLRPESAEDYVGQIPGIRAEIQRALDASIYEPKHFEKIRWLAIYWNELALSIGAKAVDFPQLPHLNPEKA
jgi:hypothetical protein